VEVQVTVLGKQAPLATTKSYPVMQLVQAPVFGSKVPQRGLASKHLLLTLYCLAVQFTTKAGLMMQLPLTTYLKGSVQFKQAPVKTSKLSQLTLTG
jgi:hypothetical protein